MYYMYCIVYIYMHIDKIRSGDPSIGIFWLIVNVDLGWGSIEYSDNDPQKMSKNDDVMIF